jgi:hypothetical protein
MDVVVLRVPSTPAVRVLVLFRSERQRGIAVNRQHQPNTRRRAWQLRTIEEIGLNNLIGQRVSFRYEPSAAGDVIPPFLLEPGLARPAEDVVRPFTVGACAGIE